MLAVVANAALPVALRNHMICGEESATLQKSVPRARRLTTYTIEKMFFSVNKFQKCVILVIVTRKKSINNPCHSGSFFRIPSSHVNLNWHILLQANPGSYGNQFFWCKRGSELL